MKKTIQHIRTLILLLVMSALPLSICKATIVFEDFTNGDTSGAEIDGSTPIVGTTWVGNNGGAPLEYGLTSGGASEATPYSIYTDGDGRVIYGGFSNNHSNFIALGSGQVLTLSWNGVGFGGNWPNSGGYAGVSLYTGYTGTAGSGSEQEFVGEPSGANQWGVDGATTGNHNTGSTNIPAVATFTYVYDTGAWTFTTSGGGNLSGTAVAHQAFNAVRIANGNGGDIDLNSLVVDISAIATPFFAAVTPANGSLSGSRTNISIEAIDGNPATVNTNTIVMQVDGSTVTPAITKSANVTTIVYGNPGSPLSAGTLHTAFVTMKDSNNNSYTNAWSFTTGYPSLPVTLAGPFTTGGGNDLTIFTAAGESWLYTNYNSSSSRTLYTRYSMEFNNLNGETGSGGGFGGLHFFLGNTEHLLVGNNWGSLNWSYDAAAGGAADLNITNSTLLINFGEWHTIVVRTDYVPNSTADNVTIYFDPDFTQTEGNQNPQNVTHLTTDATFDNVRLRCGNGTASAEWTNIIVGALSTDVGFAAPTAPVFQGYVPGVGAPSAYVDTPISVQIVPGSVGISTNSISMSLDSNPVTPTFSVSGSIIAVNYQPPIHFVTGSGHTVSVSLTDTNGTPYSTSWSFTVDSYPSLPVTIAGPISVTGGGLGTQIFGSTNEWISGNYLSSSTNTLYTRFSMTFDDVNGDNGQGGAFGGLEFYLGGTEHLLTGKYWGATNWSTGAGAPNDNIPPITPIPPALGSWHTLVVKTVYATNANDQVEVWLDPDFTKTEGNQPIWPPLTLSMNNTFDGIYLRCGNGSAFAQFSNIVIAATAPGIGFPAAVPSGMLSVANGAGGEQLSWTSIGTLQAAPSLTGPWSDYSNQANPQLLSATNTTLFFRLRQ